MMLPPSLEKLYRSTHKSYQVPFWQFPNRLFETISSCDDKTPAKCDVSALLLNVAATTDLSSGLWVNENTFFFFKDETVLCVNERLIKNTQKIRFCFFVRTKQAPQRSFTLAHSGQSNPEKEVKQPCPKMHHSSLCCTPHPLRSAPLSLPLKMD